MKQDYLPRDTVFDGCDVLGNRLAEFWDAKSNTRDARADLIVEYKTNAESTTRFASVQEAIDQAIENGLHKRDKQRVTIRISAGFFVGPIVIPREAPPITLMGSGSEHTIIAAAIDAQMSGAEYATRFDNVINNSRAISQQRFSKITARQQVNTVNSAVVSITRSDTIIANLTIRNDYQCDRITAAPAADTPDSVGRFAHGQHQAVALQVDECDRVQIIDCVLTSFQDTLYLRNQGAQISRVHLSGCMIEGDVDFIFGGATAYFENCNIKTRGERGAQSWAVAPSTSLRLPFGFVFDSCSFSHDGHEAGQNRRSFLGRQWFEGVRASPYGKATVTGFTCNYSDTNYYDAPNGTISRQTLECVGKCQIQNSQIGTHISNTKPWGSWSGDHWNPRFRPVQSTASDFLENLDSWLAKNELDYSWLNPNESWLSILR